VAASGANPATRYSAVPETVPLPTARRSTPRRRAATCDHGTEPARKEPARIAAGRHARSALATAARYRIAGSTRLIDLPARLPVTPRPVTRRRGGGAGAGSSSSPRSRSSLLSSLDRSLPPSSFGSRRRPSTSNRPSATFVLARAPSRERFPHFQNRACTRTRRQAASRSTPSTAGTTTIRWRRRSPYATRGAARSSPGARSPSVSTTRSSARSSPVSPCRGTVAITSSSG
jgi:hypothetical protein